MTLRGFIRNEGGNYRARFVLPGYSADNFSLDPNAVAFDSEMVKTAFVYTTGTWSGNLTTTRTKIISWTSPGFVPMVSIWHMESADVDSNFSLVYDIPPFVTMELSVEADGIYGLYDPVGASTSLARAFRYVVWKLDANG